MRTATNLSALDAADSKDETALSTLMPADSPGGDRSNYFDGPGRAACEAIINHYETGLNAADGAILHVGAGRGEFMDTLRQHGFSVMGCEPSPLMAKLACALYGFDPHTLYCCNVEEFLRWAKRIGKKAQAIFFRHGWEHNLELQALMPRMEEILQNGGRIIAVLPPPASGYPREAHLSFLNELALASASCDVNFEIERVDCDEGNRFMAFVLKKTAT
jgi:hypothetical protein